LILCDLSFDRSRARLLDPFVKLSQGQFALRPVPLLAVANLFLESGQKIKGDVRRLKVFRLGVRYVIR
jgi:hypothetical protein